MRSAWKILLSTFPSKFERLRAYSSKLIANALKVDVKCPYLPKNNTSHIGNTGTNYRPLISCTSPYANGSIRGYVRVQAERELIETGYAERRNSRLWEVSVPLTTGKTMPKDKSTNSLPDTKATYSLPDSTISCRPFKGNRLFSALYATLDITYYLNDRLLR